MVIRKITIPPVFAFSANTIVKIIYLEYLFCGITMLVFNKLFKLKASGHARGVIGPMLLMIYFKLYIAAAVCALFAIPVFIASVHTKEETHANAASWWSFDTACDAYNCGFNLMTLGVSQ